MSKEVFGQIYAVDTLQKGALEDGLLGAESVQLLNSACLSPISSGGGLDHKGITTFLRRYNAKGAPTGANSSALGNVLHKMKCIDAFY